MNDSAKKTLAIVLILCGALAIVLLVPQTGWFRNDDRNTNIILDGTYGVGAYSAFGYFIFDNNNFVFERDGKQVFSVKCKITKSTVYDTVIYAIDVISKSDVSNPAYSYLIDTGGNTLAFYHPDTDTITFLVSTYFRIK